MKKFHSACALADHWGTLYTITAAGLDDDFIWMAAIVLWERLAPQVMNSERLDDMMQRGYKLVEAKRRREGCTLWLQVWEHLKERFTPDMKSIADAERVFSGLQCLSNWCQDLEHELWPAGDEEASFYEKRIKYCREFCQLFPETEDLTLRPGLVEYDDLRAAALLPGAAVNEVRNQVTDGRLQLRIVSYASDVEIDIVIVQF